MKARGFSLLEVVVALAILSLSLMAIFDLNAGAVASHVYVKRLTIATLLARSKMTDLEQKLYDKGFSNDDEEDSGDFSDEGWASFKWRAKIIAPKTDGMTPQQLIGGLFNLPMGDGKEGSDPMGGLGALFGGGADTMKGRDPAGGGAGGMGALAALGPMAGLMQGQFTQMVDQLTKAVREVHLTVTWKEGKQVESFDLVTHVVSLGQGSDRNGGAGAGGAGGLPQASGPVPGIDSVTRGPCLCTVSGSGLTCPSTGNPCTPGAAGTQWFDQVTGALVTNPVPGGAGMTNPATGNPVGPVPPGGVNPNPNAIPGARGGLLDTFGKNPGGRLFNNLETKPRFGNPRGGGP